MAWLVVIAGENEGHTYDLGQKMTTMGRAPVNPVQIVDDKASRRHALIRWETDHYVLRDLRSRNGTLVNGDQVQERILEDGDVIAIGKTKLRFQTQQDGGTTEASSVKVASRSATAATVSLQRGDIEGLSTLDEPQELTGDDILQIARSQKPTERIQSMKAIQFIADIKRWGGSDLPSREVFDRTLQQLLRYTSADRSYLILIKDGKLTLYGLRYQESLSPDLRKIPMDRELVTKSILDRHTLSDSHPGDDSPNGLCGASAPLVKDETGPFGALYMDRVGSMRYPFGQEETLLLELVAVETTAVLLDRASRSS